ncbi:MAG: fused MFS/spermidine synthase [Baekduia sp.]
MSTGTRGERQAVPGAEGVVATPIVAPTGLMPAVAAAIVFVASGAVLMLEILAVRLLAPYVGLTLETTTSIIGAVLAGIALGAAVGGWFADRRDPRRLLVGLLIGGGLLALLTVPIVRWLGPGARGHGDLAALGITVASLVPSAAVLSAVSPTVARLQLNDLHTSGTIVGRLSAFATAGALVGTFGTGFVVVPLMPVSTAVLGIGIALVIVGLVLGVSLRAFGRAAGAGAVAATIVLAALAATRDSPCDVETRYHCAVIEVSGSPTGRDLLLDNQHNSYIDLADPKVLQYSYTKWVARVVDASAPAGRPRNAVFVGGGGGTLPRWFVATRPGSHAEVLEVDDELITLDQERLGLKLSQALVAKVGDARTTVRKLPSGSADIVVGDAFSGLTVPWHLLTREWIADIRRVLKPGGLYILNLIDFRPNNLLKAELATLLPLFRDVQLMSFPAEDGLPAGGNEVIIASDTERAYPYDPAVDGANLYDRDEVEALAKGGTHLRDDFAPVDQLVSRPPMSLR